jgi:hypothetical protein
MNLGPEFKRWNDGDEQVVRDVRWPAMPMGVYHAARK